jgi:hypothetical protein
LIVLTFAFCVRQSQSAIADHQSPITNHQSQITSGQSPLQPEENQEQVTVTYPMELASE